MPFAAGILFLTMALWVVLSARAAEPGGEGPLSTGSAPGAAPFEKEIERARDDLRNMERGNEGASGWGLSELASMAALLLAFGLLLLATRWTRGVFSRHPAAREMRLLDRMAVGRQSTLLLIRLRGRDYWLADTPRGISLLADWPEPGRDASPPSAPPAEPGVLRPHN